MHSTTKICICHKCGSSLTLHNGAHHQTVQDLPILGKRVILDMQIYDYNCNNPNCAAASVKDTFNEFLSYNSHMTYRLEYFLCALAAQTSCEAAARIMKLNNVKISGDTIIRLLLKEYSKESDVKCSPSVGIDDFSFKKRHRYRTIIVDESTHKPVTILNSRDGETLKEWLKKINM